MEEVREWRGGKGEGQGVEREEGVTDMEGGGEGRRMEWRK